MPSVLVLPLVSAAIEKVAESTNLVESINRSAHVPVAELDREWRRPIKHIPLVRWVLLLHSKCYVAANHAVQLLHHFCKGIALGGKVQLNAERLPLLASHLRKTPNFPLV